MVKSNRPSSGRRTSSARRPTSAKSKRKVSFEEPLNDTEASRFLIVQGIRPKTAKATYNRRTISSRKELVKKIRAKKQKPKKRPNSPARQYNLKRTHEKFNLLAPRRGSSSTHSMSLRPRSSISRS